MAEAICLSCGFEKAKAKKTCKHCGFDPTNHDLDLVKSIYLSAGRYDEPEDQDRYRLQLDSLGASIRSGKGVEFDPREIDRLVDLGRMVESMTGPRVAVYVLRVLLPGLIFVGATLLLLVLVKLLR